VTGISPEVVVVDQDEIPGTGRAVEVALDAVPDFAGDVLVLSGDVPLLDAETLSALIRDHRSSRAAITLLSAVLDDATGYGRVVRATNGGVERIVEQKDATAAEAAITEINAGVYVFQAEMLRRSSRSSAPRTRRARSTSPTSWAWPARRARRHGIRRLRRHAHARRQRPRAARRGRAPAQRAHRAPLAARRRHDPGSGDDLDRRHRDLAPT
jgi:hypothetical protein